MSTTRTRSLSSQGSVATASAPPSAAVSPEHWPPSLRHRFACEHIEYSRQLADLVERERLLATQLAAWRTAAENRIDELPVDADALRLLGREAPPPPPPTAAEIQQAVTCRYRAAEVAIELARRARDRDPQPDEIRTLSRELAAVRRARELLAGQVEESRHQAIERMRRGVADCLARARAGAASAVSLLLGELAKLQELGEDARQTGYFDSDVPGICEELGRPDDPASPLARCVAALRSRLYSV